MILWHVQGTRWGNIDFNFAFQTTGNSDRHLISFLLCLSLFLWLSFSNLLFICYHFPCCFLLFLCFSLFLLPLFLSAFPLFETVTYKTLKCCADTVIMASWQATLVMITIMLIVWFYAVFITYTRGLLCFTQIEVLSGEQRRTICLCLFKISPSLFAYLLLSDHPWSFLICHIHPFFPASACLSPSSSCLTLYHPPSPPPPPSASVFWLVVCGGMR